VNTKARSDTDLDIRSLRYFVAVADELHFTRAASRLFVAQQALSREIRRLEERLGAPLLVRTTRRVTLTPEGLQLLIEARELIRLHDRLLAQFRDPTRPVLVDLMSEGRQTGIRVLEAAREIAPNLEFRGRYGGGMGSSLRRLEAAELDVAFGRAQWRGRRETGLIQLDLLRFEPLALLLPLKHPLASRSSIRVDDLKGIQIDANPANPDALEWSDLASQFLHLAAAYPTPDHVSAVGLADQAHHLVQQGLPILTTVDHVDVPGGVVRPIVEPVAMYCWSVAWRVGAHPVGLAAIRDAATAMRANNGWLELPESVWLPEPEASTLAAPTLAV